MADLLSLADAQSLVREHAQPLESEEVALRDALGRFLAEDVAARTDLPPFASSAMDGYAVRAEDTPGRLPVVARIAAGRPVEQAMRAGEAMGIATGGVVPDGADAVVPVEYVVEYDNEVEVSDPVVQMANVRPRGGDVRTGDVVARAGTRVAAATVGALAAAGIADVVCARRPRVAIVATGTELRPPGQPLAPGQVYEANAPMLASALAAANADIVELPAVADDADEHRRVFERALTADVVVTSGGVSVGPHDLVRSALRDLGVREIFWRVAVKPGKPVSFGVRKRTLVFGLPGNPVSSLVGCELFVRPALLAQQGASDPGPVYGIGALTMTVRRNAERDELLRARAETTDDGIRLEPVTGQESHMIVRSAGANALVLVPRGEGEIAAGERVRYLALV